MSYRPDWWEESANLLPLCEELHGHTCGSGPSLDGHNRLQTVVDHLVWALANWVEPTNGYDLCVKRLIMETLSDYYKWKNERIEIAKPIDQSNTCLSES